MMQHVMTPKVQSYKIVSKKEMGLLFLLQNIQNM